MNEKRGGGYGIVTLISYKFTVPFEIISIHPPPAVLVIMLNSPTIHGAEIANLKKKTMSLHFFSLYLSSDIKKCNTFYESQVMVVYTRAQAPLFFVNTKTKPITR